MNNKEKTKINLIEKIKSNKKIQYLLIIIFSLLIVAVFLVGTYKSEEKTEEDVAAQYILQLEKKLTDVLSKVSGVGKVSVIIKTDGKMETVIATKTITNENASGKTVEETPVLVNGKTVVLQELYPKITGVLIVCEGAQSISVMNKIQQATLSLLDIDIASIEILAMK